MTEKPFCILYGNIKFLHANIQLDKTSIYFPRFSDKNTHYGSKVLNNNSSIKKGMNLRKNTTCMRIILFNGCN